MLLWVFFLLLIGLALALDLGIFHREARKMTIREATAWSMVWITLSLLFSVVVYFAYEDDWYHIRALSDSYLSGREAVLLYLSGYLLEKSLSMDNIFVMAVIFRFFRVPGAYQHRVLFWGILGALVFRAIMIFAGVALLQQFEWLIYLFGAFLIYAALKMWSQDDDAEPDLRDNRLLVLMRRWLPVTRNFHGERFFLRRGRIWLATPLFLCLLMIEFTDILFALDSIPAIFSITRDPFLIFTSNILAILGLRAMYFMLAAVLDQFRYLKYSVVAILLFVGLKMVGHSVVHVPAWLTLVIIGGSLLAGILASMLVRRPKEESEEDVLSQIPPL
jgi:tellurite resistance protein TerC